jgi:siroheme synthase-like protein
LQLSSQLPVNIPPPYFPVFLDLRGKRCVVVGGGAVARRKVAALLEAGAAVTVIAPSATGMPDGVDIIARPFMPEDLAGAWLVIAATDDAEVNARVAREAEARHILVNVVDMPELCTMILPAVVRRGALRIAISTAGASPTLARALKEELEARYGHEYGELVTLLWQLRRAWEPRMIAGAVPPPRRRELWLEVLALPLLDLLRDGKSDEAATCATALLAMAITL